MKFETFIPGQAMNDAGRAITEMLRDLNLGVCYADMMRLRLSGQVSGQCADTYFVAHENGVCYSRLWNGWGIHDGAIGNFGNFLTLEACRGQGIGKKMLQMWHDDLHNRKDKPLALFCSANERVENMYFAYGFRPAIKGTTGGHLYLPLKNSPDTFQQFCEMYYQPSALLIARDASVQYRHEIDCLLRFALADLGLLHEIGEISKVEEALLYHKGEGEMLFSEAGRCVGWRINGITRLHPQYEGINIIKE